MVNSEMISKIEKAKRYAEERHRIHFTSLSVSFDGENGTHNVTLNGDHWHCDCHFFQSRGWCCHTMALERVLDKMVPISAAMPG